MSKELTGMDLLNELNNLNRQLPEAIRLMGGYGRKFANAQRRYRVEIAKETARLKANGTPATLIRDLLFNSEDVATSLFERDESEVLYKTSQEHINALKTEIRVIEALIDKEWANGGN